jgi:hypothetical protein
MTMSQKYELVWLISDRAVAFKAAGRRSRWFTHAMWAADHWYRERDLIDDEDAPFQPARHLNVAETVRPSSLFAAGVC